MRDHPPVTIGVVNHNGMECLPRTLNGLRGLRYPNFTLMIVDDRSNDGSDEWIRRNFPDARCFFLSENVGSAGARNVVLREADTELVFLLDNDVRVEPDALTCLVEAIQTSPEIALAHADVRDVEDPEIFHFNGGRIHYLCALISRQRPARNENRPPLETYDVFSGQAILVRRSLAWALVGGFDEDYFFNWEDGDFSARLTLTGKQCVNVPKAVVHHRFKPRGTSKVFFQVRNRWFFIVKLYDFRTLVFISPAMVVFELGQCVFLALKGAHRDYFKGTLAAIQSLPSLLEKRRKFQKLKELEDSEWLHCGALFVPSQIALSKGLIEKIVGGITFALNLYWIKVKTIV